MEDTMLTNKKKKKKIGAVFTSDEARNFDEGGQIIPSF